MTECQSLINLVPLHPVPGVDSLFGLERWAVSVTEHVRVWFYGLIAINGVEKRPKHPSLLFSVSSSSVPSPLPPANPNPLAKGRELAGAEGSGRPHDAAR